METHIFEIKSKTHLPTPIYINLLWLNDKLIRECVFINYSLVLSIFVNTCIMFIKLTETPVGGKYLPWAMSHTQEKLAKYLPNDGTFA